MRVTDRLTLVTVVMGMLYLCYFGMREPLVQTQVLPYLRQLVAGGVKVNILTFEPELRRRWTPEQLDAERRRLAAEGIRWFCLPYHKSPSLPATLYDIAAGARFIARLVRREQIKVLHARSHVPMAMALLVRRLTRCQLVFDIRGLMAEEYADAGIWGESSPQFRAVKRLERAGIRRADHLIVLTERMRDWLVERRLKDAGQIEVVPCCVDFVRFPAVLPGEAAPVGNRFEVVYAGSVVGLYLLEEMGRFFLAVQAERPDAFLRILTASPPAETAAALRRVGVRDEDFAVAFAAPADIPRYLRQARLGVSFRKATFSQIAASPTKVPEYLAAGLPVVCNAGIGDMDELITREQVGVVVSGFSPETLAAAAAQAVSLYGDPDLRARCARVARQYFDLHSVGGAGYRNVYRQLLGTT